MLRVRSTTVLSLRWCWSRSSRPRVPVDRRERRILAPALGSNVIVFDPSMPVGQIQATIDAIHAQQVDAEMSTNRYALLFEPGSYGTVDQPLQLKVGYYTEIAGLGASPTDVTINGKIEVYNRSLAPDNCVALVNFLAHAFQPVAEHQRAGPGRLSRLCELLGGLQAVSMRRLDVAGGNPR